MWAPKIAEIGNFWYKFAQKGYTPLSDFLQYLASGGSPGSAFFGINLALLENFRGQQKKLNKGAQLLTFLYAMTP